VLATKQCVCTAELDERGKTYYTVEASDPPTKSDTYRDERTARVATALRSRAPRCTDERWSRGEARPPVSLAVDGPEALAGWLYLRHQDSRHADDYDSPYKYISYEMDVREQTARNYVYRLLDEAE